MWGGNFQRKYILYKMWSENGRFGMSNTKNFCSNCGEKITQENNFCTKCGSQLTDISQPTDNQSRIGVELPQNFNEKSKSTNIQNNPTSSPIWYFFTVLCGFVGGVISFLVLRKNQPKKAKTCLILGLVLTIGTTGIWFVLMTTYGTDNPFFVVSTGSMMPELEVYDIIVADGNIQFQNVNVGDIIVFNRPNGHDRIIVHRVEAILDDNPVLKTVRTRGDANPISIPGTDYPVTDEEYIGKVVYVIPQLGYVTRVLAPPINYLIVVIIAVVALVSHFGYKRELKKNGMNI